VKKWIFFLLVLAAGVYWYQSAQGKRYPPGILIPNDPKMVMIDNGTPWKVRSKDKEYQITPRAEYTLDARVLSINKGYGDALIGPADITVGWGPMSDQQVLDRMKIWQDNMRYWYCAPKGGDWPIPMEEVALHAVNTHIIPADAEIEKRVNSVRKGDLIQVKGYLVDVTRPDGFSWNTSTDPRGFGDHSCKIIWVKELATR
jgi:hypothetical protein